MANATEAGVSKSQSIREYLKSVKPSERGPTEVAAALKTKGVDVTPSFVSFVKSKMKTKGKKVSKKKKTTKAKIKAKVYRRSDKTPVHESLIHAANFLNSAGGLAEAKRLLDVVNVIRS